MKSTFLSILTLAAIISFTACKNDKKEETAPAPTTEAPAAPAAPTTNDVQATPTPPPQGAEPAQNAKGVWHYICSKNCPGGAGAQGTCPKCGAPLQHNTAYHQQ